MDGHVVGEQVIGAIAVEHRRSQRRTKYCETDAFWHTQYMKTFTEKVRTIVRKIPKGKTMTYKEVATKAGNPKAARAVGAVMRSNYDPSIPCHRVIASDGTMRGYNRSLAAQRRRPK